MKLENIIEKMTGYQPIPAKMPREAAVLCLLTEVEGEAAVVLEVRSKRLSHQPGEICFPGGGIEPGETPLDCALRETEEELGIRRESVHLIAPLDAIIHSSGQRIYPFLGWIEALSALNVQRGEVEEVFTLPLDWLRTHPPKQAVYALTPDWAVCPAELAAFLPNYRRERPTIIWTWKDKVLWGMTAKILFRLLKCLSGNVVSQEHPKEDNQQRRIPFQSEQQTGEEQ